ncbi:MFS transporter OS=Streptomyces tendae OX=1932 GN=GUR47_36610 PE=4 SV=1 [Streptomyces tendae]
MAALGSIGTALYRHGVPSDAPAPAEETLGGALAVAAELPGRAGDALATAAREAFTDGMQGAAIAGALLLLGAAVSAALGLRHIRVRPEAETANAGQADQLSPSGV